MCITCLPVSFAAETSTGKIIFTILAEEGDVPEFTIINTPKDTPTQPDESETPDETTKNCTCMCHSNEFIRFIHKLLCFFFRIFGMEQHRVCSCGKAHW